MREKRCGDCKKFELGGNCYSSSGRLLRSNCSVIDRACEKYKEDMWKLRMEKTRSATMGW